MKNMLKIITVILVLTSSSFAKSDHIRLMIDGKVIETDAKPIASNGRTLVPIRAVSENLHAEVTWNNQSQQVSLNFDSLDLIIEMKINSNIYYINGQAGEMGTAPKIVNGHTLVPIRFISESLGFEVKWDSKDKIVSIYSKASKKNPLEDMEDKMFELVNIERDKNKLPRLKVDEELRDLARLKSKDFDDNNYFNHNSAKYGSPFDMMKKFGIKYKVAAENIAGNQSVEEAHIRLMNSPGHRENILNPQITHIGIGIAENKTYEYGFTQMFIKKS